MNVQAAHSWIQEGQKYALIGLSVNADHDLEFEIPGSEVAVIPDVSFKVPNHWRTWLGSMRVEEIEQCNIFIVAKSDTSPAGVLDAESQRLQRKVWNFYIGLLLGSGMRPSHKPVRLTGGCEKGE